MQEVQKNIQNRTLNGATGPVLAQAEHKLKQHIRDAFIKRQIVLNTQYEVRPVSDLENPNEDIVLEVIVFQRIPIKRDFKLCTVTMQVVINANGPELEQKIYWEDEENPTPGSGRPEGPQGEGQQGN